MSVSMNEMDLSMHNSDAADRRLSVRFKMEAKIDRNKTEQEGREVYREVEYVTILIPGDKTLTVHRPVQPADKVRFAEQYRAFKAQQGETLIGTPLAGWPMVTEAQRRELEYFNIRSVEQLAEVADGYVAGMMGIQQLKRAAQKFLQTINDNAPTIKLQKELEKRDGEMEVLRSQLQEQADMLKQLIKKGSKE